MGANADRAAATMQLLTEYESVDTEFVAQELGCGHGQAARAIRTARAALASDGQRVSYANANNNYVVAMEGDGLERTRSYVARLRSITTQRTNAAHVMSASVDHGSSSKIERALGRMALADQHQVEADRIRLEALTELLP